MLCSGSRADVGQWRPKPREGPGGQPGPLYCRAAVAAEKGPQVAAPHHVIYPAGRVPLDAPLAERAAGCPLVRPHERSRPPRHGGDDVIALRAETWRAVRDRAEQLLGDAEADGLTGALRWLTERRVAWSWARVSGSHGPEALVAAVLQ